MTSLLLVWNPRHIFRLWSPNKRYSTNMRVDVISAVKNGVYVAHLGTAGSPSTQIIAVKTARGSVGLDNLEREVGFYENQLLPLQGTVVPRIYGYFRGEIRGEEFGCLLMEYCIGPAPLDLREAYRLIMVHACQLHEAGIMHGNLIDSHHFLVMGNGIRIIDFSTASLHKCRQGTPWLWASGQSLVGCGELQRLEATYGIYSGAPYDH